MPSRVFITSSWPCVCVWSVRLCGQPAKESRCARLRCQLSLQIRSLGFDRRPAPRIASWIVTGGQRLALYERTRPRVCLRKLRSHRLLHSRVSHQRSLSRLQALPDDWPWPDVNYKAVVMYDGTRFNGFQLNPSGRTVQEVLEKALCKTRQESRVSLRMHAAGRTDAGVHARGQVVSFRSARLDEDLDHMQHKLNSCLPADARIASVQIVPPDFSARYSAVRKQYIYELHTQPVLDPMCRAYCMHVPGHLDIDAIRQAAAQYVGVHDFFQFASTGSHSSKPQGVHKNAERCDVIDTPEGLRIEITASGFLYKMVRHMVGCLIAIGQGHLPPEHVSHLLAVGASRPLGNDYRGWNAAKPQGLCLQRVDYPPHSDPRSFVHPDLPHTASGRIASAAPADADADSALES